VELRYARLTAENAGCLRRGLRDGRLATGPRHPFNSFHIDPDLGARASRVDID